MLLDPAHELAVIMRIMRKSTDVCIHMYILYAAESRDVSVTCQRAEALASC